MAGKRGKKRDEDPREKRRWRSERSEKSSEIAQRKTVENRDPELAAAVGEQIDKHDRLKDFLKAAEACGMPKAMANALKRRMETRYLPATEAFRKTDTRELLRLLDDRAVKALEYMDDVAFAEAPLRDLAVSLGILIEKRQLLRGEPTQILTVEERSNLNDLIPAIVKEAKRRGMVIDSTPVRVDDEDGVHTTVLPAPTQRGHVDHTHARLEGFPDSLD